MQPRFAGWHADGRMDMQCANLKLSRIRCRRIAPSWREYEVTVQIMHTVTEFVPSYLGIYLIYIRMPLYVWKYGDMKLGGNYSIKLCIDDYV